MWVPNTIQLHMFVYNDLQNLSALYSLLFAQILQADASICCYTQHHIWYVVMVNIYGAY